MEFPCNGSLVSILWDKDSIECIREDGHLGKHQAFRPNPEFPGYSFSITWDEDEHGAFLRSPDLWNECDSCVILIQGTSSQCDDCLLEDRIHDIVKRYSDDMIICDGNIYIDQEHTAKNRKVDLKVSWLDKEKKSMVSAYLLNVTGPMPKKYREALPDNACIYTMDDEF